MKSKTKKSLVVKSEVIDLFNQTETTEINIKITKQHNLFDDKTVDVFIGDTEIAKSKPLDVKVEDIKELVVHKPLPNGGRRNIMYCEIVLNCHIKKYFSKSTWLMVLTYEDMLNYDSKDLLNSIEQKFLITKKDKYIVCLSKCVSLGMENYK